MIQTHSSCNWNLQLCAYQMQLSPTILALVNATMCL
jgi:hypothetical protein